MSLDQPSIKPVANAGADPVVRFGRAVAWPGMTYTARGSSTQHTAAPVAARKGHPGGRCKETIRRRSVSRATPGLEGWISPYSLQPVHHRTSSIIGSALSSARHCTRTKSHNIHRRRRRERRRQNLDFLLDDEALDLLARKRRRAPAELVFAGLVASFVLRKGGEGGGVKHEALSAPDCAVHVKSPRGIGTYRHLVVSEHLGLVLGDDAHIDVGP